MNIRHTLQDYCLLFKIKPVLIYSSVVKEIRIWINGRASVVGSNPNPAILLLPVLNVRLVLKRITPRIIKQEYNLLLLLVNIK